MDNTRRAFLQITAAAALSAPVTAQTRTSGKQPWYLRTYRWGQTNITEQDPIQYDIAWWRDYWKRTEVQGVIVNAGGIVAYYPSKFPLHRRAKFLGDRDLFGELTRAAHEQGIAFRRRVGRQIPDQAAAGDGPDDQRPAVGAKSQAILQGQQPADGQRRHD